MSETAVDPLHLRRLAQATSPALLLSPVQMGEADRQAIAAGIPGSVLMDNAGRAVAREIVARWTPCPVVVACGPGNNAGDGFVAAVALRAAGWTVSVALSCNPGDLRGDAAAAAWGAAFSSLTLASLEGAGLVVDALFGAGLNRPLDGSEAAFLVAAQDAGLPIVAVDVPSGVDGAQGRCADLPPPPR